MNTRFEQKLNKILNEDISPSRTSVSDPGKVYEPTNTSTNVSLPDIAKITNSVDNIGDEIYGTPDDSKEYPESDLKPISKRIINIVRKLVTTMALPIYGPVVYIIDKLVPTSMIAELLRDLKYFGDTLIGDAKMKRRLQKAIRTSAVKRLEIKNEKMQQEVIDGLWDDKLEALRYNNPVTDFDNQYPLRSSGQSTVPDDQLFKWLKRKGMTVNLNDVEDVKSASEQIEKKFDERVGSVSWESDNYDQEMLRLMKLHVKRLGN
tara:strand:- start:307 stop:1092 length:786 start_codon:yes stop_codon:yes gene_type:complete